MDKKATKDISDDELEKVVGGTVSTQATKPVSTLKKTPDVIEHREGGAH